MISSDYGSTEGSVRRATDSLHHGLLVSALNPAHGACPDRDLALVGRLLAGDEAAFAEAVSAYSPVMLHVARGFVSTRASAEDVVQEAWLGVCRGLEGFEGAVILADLGAGHHAQRGPAARCGGCEGTALVAD